MTLAVLRAASARGAAPLARALSAGWSTGADPAAAIEDAARKALILSATMPDAVVAGVGSAASAAGRDAEKRGLAAALERSVEDAHGLLSHVGSALGETMSASGLLGAVAACAKDAKRPALIVCADEAADRPAAAAILIAAA